MKSEARQKGYGIQVQKFPYLANKNPGKSIGLWERLMGLLKSSQKKNWDGFWVFTSSASMPLI